MQTNPGTMLVFKIPLKNKGNTIIGKLKQERS